MGKPYTAELEQIPHTALWANEIEVGPIRNIICRYTHPVYIIGSGGSFSACIYAADLLTNNGVFAKAVTPLELFYASSTIKKSNLIFISASGRNTDILFALKNAIDYEPISVMTICMSKKTKLTALANEYSSCYSFEFSPPAGKDGFLATNTLAAYFVILYRAIENKKLEFIPTLLEESFFSTFFDMLTNSTIFQILYGSYFHAVAVDLESKFSEAGLAGSLLSDFRHFAHGRHQWFDKKKDSAIIALTNNADKKLCDKTLQLLPQSIPKLLIHTDVDGCEGVIHSLLHSMQIIKYYGNVRGIDPGRPGVPDYGSKIYHLKYDRLIKQKALSREDISIIRKAKTNKIANIEESDLANLRYAYRNFNKKISEANFGALVFDYDGTLCSPENRYTGPQTNTASALVEFVKKGFVLGIVSGRGKSLRTDLTKAFDNDKNLMERVVVGYYNGSDIAKLNDDSHPNKNLEMYPSLKIAKQRLEKLGINLDSSPNQLTLGAASTDKWINLRERLLNEIMLMGLEDITIVESSHSIDIIPRKIASKNHILEHCKKLCLEFNLSPEILCVGDKGQWPGNDFELLSNQHALSVWEVSSDINTGWNIFPPSIRDEKAVNHLFKSINYQNGYFTLSNL